MKVLVVDDSKMVRMTLTAKLKNLDIEVIEAEDGAKALEKIVEEKPSLIFLDIMMPVMDGLELCRHVRQVYDKKEIPIIMLTSKRNDVDVKAAISAGASDYMVKPFTFEDIEAKLNKYLDLENNG